MFLHTGLTIARPLSGGIGVYSPGNTSLAGGRPFLHWKPFAEPWNMSLMNGYAIGIPLWLPFLIVFIPTAVLFWFDRKRLPPGHCRVCGYNLTGNQSGVCSECGERVPQAAASTEGD